MGLGLGLGVGLGLGLGLVGEKGLQLIGRKVQHPQRSEGAGAERTTQRRGGLEM